jgi:trk system potassium uptake protein
MKVILMGCGRIGSQVSRVLDNQGHDMTVIDDCAENLERLGEGFKGKKIVGVGFDREILNKAGIEHADAFVATSSSDNLNIVAARIARNIFHVPRVVCRLYDPRRAEIYRRLGLVTISMVSWGAQRISELLSHSDLEPNFYFGKGEVSMIPFEIPTQLVGRRVKDATISGEISVISISRLGEAVLATPEMEFQAEDMVYFAVQASAMDRFEALMGL